MTFREKLICRILLIIARIAAEDERLLKDLKDLDSHISVGDWRSNAEKA